LWYTLHRTTIVMNCNEALDPGDPHPPNLRRYRPRHAAMAERFTRTTQRVHLFRARCSRARRALPIIRSSPLQLADSNPGDYLTEESRAVRSSSRETPPASARLRQYLPHRGAKLASGCGHTRNCFHALSCVELRHDGRLSRFRRLRIRRSRRAASGLVALPVSEK